jgi:hypothetical protein
VIELETRAETMKKVELNNLEKGPGLMSGALYVGGEEGTEGEERGRG